MLTGVNTWRQRLSVSCDGASLAILRIAFGVLMVWFAVEAAWSGSFLYKYVAVPFSFKYPGFGWLDMGPEEVLLCLKLIGGSGIFVALGFLHRISSAVLFLAFTALFLENQLEYQNHYYLICLLSFVMVLVPAAAVWSVDNVVFKRSARKVPIWSVWIWRFQLGVVYFYAGLAKLNPDWLQGFPLYSWTQQSVDHPVVGPLVQMPLAYLVFSYVGLILDLFIAPALLYRKTRLAAFWMITAFHLMNSQLFNIGIFPLLAIACTTVFLDPSWPRRFFKPAAEADDVAPIANLTMVVLGIFLTLQLAMPLRHYIFTNDVNWTRTGHQFAWRMKLNSRSGILTFIMKDQATGKITYVLPEAIFSPRHARRISTRPELIRQFAHWIRRGEEADGRQVEVFASSYLSLNGRDYQMFIDPKVDLSRQPYSPIEYSWILPNEIENPQKQPPKLPKIVLEGRPDVPTTIELEVTKEG